MAGVVGVAVFVISEKKRKGDIGFTQTGIDPSQSTGVSTSTWLWRLQNQQRRSTFEI